MCHRYSVLARLIILFLTLIVQGCGNPLSFLKKTPTEVQSQTKTLMKSIATPLEQPNHYQVNLRWAPFLFENPDSEDRTWMIFKGKDSKPLVPWLSVSLNQTEAKDLEIEAGAFYTYAVGFWRNSQFIEQARSQVKVPMDLVVSNLIQASNLTQFSRVYITKTGIIETQGARLELGSDELISDGGTIRSFEPSSTAPIGLHGINPDILVIKVKKASGFLKIQAIGQPGGKGQPGPPGTPGPDGDYHSPCIEPKRAYAETGFPGHPGTIGSPGGNGGNSPKIYIEVLNSNHFDFSIEKTPGQGGAGGEGGPGGIGGKWINMTNNGLKRFPTVQCRDPHKYVTGPIGPQGPQGSPGANGKQLPHCTRVEGKEGGDCSQFFEKNGFIF